MASPVIDVHTHVLTEAWFELLQAYGGPRYTVKQVVGGMRAIHLDGAPFMTPVPPMFDYGLRLRTMDTCGVDVCVVSLTCPNVFWGRARRQPQGRASHERRHGGCAERIRTGCAGSRRCRGSTSTARWRSSIARTRPERPASWCSRTSTAAR